MLLYEGFGLPIIERQLLARLVITSNLFCLREVAGAGAGGSFVDPYNSDYRNEFI